MIDQTVRVNRLLDYYQHLLTDRQAEALNLYYREDWSLAEIAEEVGVTRQGVRDHIKRGEQVLEDYEAKLELLAKADRRTSLYAQMAQHPDMTEDLRQVLEAVQELD